MTHPLDQLYRELFPIGRELHLTIPQKPDEGLFVTGKYRVVEDSQPRQNVEQSKIRNIVLERIDPPAPGLFCVPADSLLVYAWNDSAVRHDHYKAVKIEFKRFKKAREAFESMPGYEVLETVREFDFSGLHKERTSAMFIEPRAVQNDLVIGEPFTGRRWRRLFPCGQEVMVKLEAPEAVSTPVNVNMSGTTFAKGEATKEVVIPAIVLGVEFNPLTFPAYSLKVRIDEAYSKLIGLDGTLGTTLYVDPEDARKVDSDEDLDSHVRVALNCLRAGLVPSRKSNRIRYNIPCLFDLGLEEVEKVEPRKRGFLFLPKALSALLDGESPDEDELAYCMMMASLYGGNNQHLKAEFNKDDNRKPLFSERHGYTVQVCVEDLRKLQQGLRQQAEAQAEAVGAMLNPVKVQEVKPAQEPAEKYRHIKEGDRVTLVGSSEVVYEVVSRCIIGEGEMAGFYLRPARTEVSRDEPLEDPFWVRAGRLSLQGPTAVAWAARRIGRVLWLRNLDPEAARAY